LTTLPKIITSDDTFEKYDFSSILNEKDKHQAISIISELIDSGIYFTNGPLYQTKSNLFGRNEDCWLKLRMSFIFSCFMYLKTEVQIKHISAWGVKTSNAIVEDREDLWHEHQISKQNKAISGILYLHIPDDVENFDLAGTEFAPNGLEDPERLFLRPDPWSWFIYPSNVYHRPCPPTSSQFRYIVAADMEF
jgi:hypothetical protein